MCYFNYPYLVCKIGLSKATLFLSVLLVIGIQTNSGLELCAQETQSSEKEQASYGLQPPIQVVNAAAAGDGGTLFVKLIGANKQCLTLKLSQYVWDPGEGDLPRNTLLLNVADPFDDDDGREGRLPKSNEEVSGVLSLLRLVEKTNYQDDGTSYIASMLRRLDQKKNHAIRDPSKGIEPKWYAAYDKKCRERYALIKRYQEREERFLGCFPANVRVLLKPSSEEPLTDVEIRLRAQKFSVAFDDPLDLCVSICRAFGVRVNDSWTLRDEPDLVLIGVLKLIDVEHFMLALNSIERDQESLLGAARILFGPSINYIEKLERFEWKQWVPRLTDLIFTKGAIGNRSLVIDAISQNSRTEVTLLLRRIAADTTYRESYSKVPEKEECNPSDLAYLSLALRNDQTVKDDISKQLESAVRAPDRAALEVSLALLGEPEYLSKAHFKLSLSRVERAALQAIEKFEGRHGIDILIYSALNRSSLVKYNATILTQRLSGQKWIPNEDTQHSYSNSNDAAAWWKENPKAFTQPYVSE